MGRTRLRSSLVRVAWWVAAASSLLVLGAGCSGADSGPEGTDAREVSEPGLSASDPADVHESSEQGAEAPDPVTPGEAEDLVAVFAGRLPVPDDAHGCIAERLAGEPGLAAGLREAGVDGELPDGVLSAAASCMEATGALPAFVESLESSTGGLSDEQRACVIEGYLTAGPDAVDAARVEALGGEADEELTGVLGEMVRDCGVSGGN